MSSRMQTTEEGRATRNQWLMAIGLAVLGGLLTVIVGVVLYFSVFFGALSAILVAATCLVAGWMLRSWWGLIATPVVYVAVAALVWMLFIAGAGMFLTPEFGLFIVLPAVVMAAIGTAIGMYGGGQRAQRPRYTQPIT